MEPEHPHISDALSPVPRAHLPAPQQAAVQRSRALYFAPGALLPLQFPSLQHFSDRVERVFLHARQVEGLSEKTIEGYHAAFSRFVAYLRATRTETGFLSGQLAAQMRILEDWIAWLRTQRANHTTVNHYWRTLHAILARIARADSVVDPTLYVATPRPGRPLPRFLTRDALEGVFAFVRNYDWPFGSFERSRNVALIAVMALGGLRLGEVLRLDFGDIDLTDAHLRIRNGKGQHGGKDRVVYMAPALHSALTTYVDARRSRHPTTTRVFLSTRGTGPMARIAIHRLCAIVTRQGAIKIAPHMLRHTCATLMRQSGIADRLAMEQLGHSSLGVLQRYSHVANGELQREMRRMTIDVDLR